MLRGRGSLGMKAMESSLVNLTNGTEKRTKAEASGPNYLPLNLEYPGLKKVFKSPPIYVVENFLTDEECEAFIRVAGPLLQRSKTHAIAGATPTNFGNARFLSLVLRQGLRQTLCACLCAWLQGARRPKDERASHATSPRYA